jgi:hypothetical protein
MARVLATEPLGLFPSFIQKPEPNGALSLLFRYGENSGDSTHAEPRFRTSCHYQILFLTRLFSKLRLKRKDFQEVARLAWAQEVPSSNLGAPTKTSRVFSWASLWNSPRQEVWIRKSFNSQDFSARRVCKNTDRQECNPEAIEQRQVKRASSGQYGENSGDSVHFWSHQSSEMQNR